MWQLSWMLSLLPDWFWTLVLVLGVAAVLASWVLKFIPFVSTYRLPLQVSGTVALLIGVFFQGSMSNEAKWQAKVKELEAAIVKAEEASKEVNKDVEVKIVEKTKVVREKGKDIITYVDREIVKKEEIIKYIEQCPVPKDIIDVHNQAAEMNKAAEGKK